MWFKKKVEPKERVCPNGDTVFRWWDWCMHCGAKTVEKEPFVWPMCECGRKQIGNFCVYCGRKNIYCGRKNK